MTLAAPVLFQRGAGGWGWEGFPFNPTSDGRDSLFILQGMGGSPFLMVLFGLLSQEPARASHDAALQQSVAGSGQTPG